MHPPSDLGGNWQGYKVNPTILALDVHVNTQDNQGSHHGTSMYSPATHFSDANYSIPQAVTVNAINDDAYVPSANIWSASVRHHVKVP